MAQGEGLSGAPAVRRGAPFRKGRQVLFSELMQGPGWGAAPDRVHQDGRVQPGDGAQQGDPGTLKGIRLNGFRVGRSVVFYPALDDDQPYFIISPHALSDTQKFNPHEVNLTISGRF